MRDQVQSNLLLLLLVGKKVKEEEEEQNWSGVLDNETLEVLW